MRKREQQDEKLMYEIAQENKRMSEPLRKARQVPPNPLLPNTVANVNTPRRTPLARRIASPEPLNSSPKERSRMKKIMAKLLIEIFWLPWPTTWE